ncbi:MAG: CHRD domain-containing protein [Candidatus Obscuribacterales bacterium]|nr:CHRD domain-containing protein [Steroidobacteraceae bacterium]
MTALTVSTVTGVGTVTAKLDGTQLTIDAKFEGLTGIATSANIRRGPKGIPGPAVFDLSAPKASSGKITATLSLTPEQVADLRAGRLYLQIHSERAPDGSIRGWLLQ